MRVATVCVYLVIGHFFLTVIGAYRSQNGIALTEGEFVSNLIWQAKGGCGVGFSRVMQLFNLLI